MEEINLTFVLMAGLRGSGKSTLADELRRALHWHLIDKDKYKEEFKRCEPSDEAATKRAYSKSFEEARSKLTKDHISVILDSAVRDESTLKNAREIILHHENIRLKVILCIADRELRLKRLRKRSSSSNDALIDGDEPATEEDYIAYYKHLPLDTKRIYTNNDKSSCLKEAIDYVIG